MALSRKHYNAIAALFRSRTDRLDESLESIKKAADDNLDFPTGWQGRFPGDPEQADLDQVRFKRLELCDMATDMANYFEQDNPNFDYDRFMKATECR